MDDLELREDPRDVMHAYADATEFRVYYRVSSSKMKYVLEFRNPYTGGFEEYDTYSHSFHMGTRVGVIAGNKEKVQVYDHKGHNESERALTPEERKQFDKGLDTIVLMEIFKAALIF